jgi:hypothetical protein
MNNQFRYFLTATQMFIQGLPVGVVCGFCANNQGGGEWSKVNAYYLLAQEGARINAR